MTHMALEKHPDEEAHIPFVMFDGLTYVATDTGNPLKAEPDRLVDEDGQIHAPIINGIARFVAQENYAESFGFQWNLFANTQIDSVNFKQSSRRFWAETQWKPEDLEQEIVLEVGSGAGRFTEVVMRETQALLATLDYSNAVDANAQTNQKYIEQGRLAICQASIYEIPFADQCFNKIFCFGMLQHTPDFRASVRALYQKLAPGGELVIDFYPIKGWWTKISAKYFLRPVTSRISKQQLLQIITKSAPALIACARFLDRIGLHMLTRFLPLCDLRNISDEHLSEQEFRQHVILDTFDMFSPAYDQPQRIETVAQWLRQEGAAINFAGFVYYETNEAAVIRAGKPL